MRNYSAKLILSIVALILGFWIASCKKENENVLIDQVPPIVETNKITDSTEYTAKGGGTILAAGGSAILRRGLIWGLTEDLDTTLKTKVISGSGRGVFLAEMKGLAPGTKYYFVAFAVNEIGMAFGEIKTFSTRPLPPGAPKLGPTTDASEIKALSAKSGGNVIDDGGFKITARGICWTTSSINLPTDKLTTKTTDSGSVGTFISELSGLTPLTTYYVRSYATNIKGTFYGNLITFTTPNIVGGSTVTDAEGNSYRTIVIGTQTWMAENLKSKKYRNGDTIQTKLPPAKWKTDTTGAYFNNTEKYFEDYGRLYNFYAIKNSKNLCPVGWHIPDSTEWAKLETFLGGNAEAGGKLKAKSEKWIGANVAKDDKLNESGFSALPGGSVSEAPTIKPEGNAAVFWTKTERGTTRAVRMNLERNLSQSDLEGNPVNKNSGLSVRCIKD
jgi:uncharacterized protein (TIGR02145 family)